MTPTPRRSLAALREALEVRAAGYSELSGAPLLAGWALHHRRPGGKGGTRREDQHTLANVVALNHDEHANHVPGSVHSNEGDWARKQGWLLPLDGPYSHPALVPIWYRRNGWHYLTTTGLVLPHESVRRLINEYRPEAPEVQGRPRPFVQP